MGGHWSSSVLNPEKDLVDLTGKVVLITGARGGVGYGAAQHLVRQGAKVYIVTRNEQGTRDAIAQLREAGLGNKGGSLEGLSFDLADLKAVASGASEFLKKETRLDILINNAAIAGTGTRKLTDDGVLDIDAINYLSPFALTQRLLPLMKRTAEEPGSDVRIINTASIAHESVKDVETFKGGKEVFTRDYGKGFFKGFKTYGYTKLASILHINELQRRLSSTHPSITCLSIDPGAVLTPGSVQFLATFPYVGPLLQMLAKFVFAPIEKGSATSVFAAASKKVLEEREKGTYKGAYLVPYGKIGSSSKWTKGELGERLARELWETTEKVLEEVGV